MHNLHIIDICIIAGYLILCLVAGLLQINKVGNIREYAVSTGRVSTPLLVSTIFATYMGAGSLIGSVEKIYSLGLLFIVAIMFEPILWVVTSKLFANYIGIFKKKGCITISDIMEVLYGKPGKWITNILAIIMAIGVLAAQITALGYLFNYFLGTSKEIGILIGFGVVVAYSTLGGIRAVIVTDFFQSLILFVAIPAAAMIAYYKMGGYNALVTNLPSSYLSIDLSKGNLILLGSLAVHAMIPNSAATFVQRFLIADSSKQLKQSLNFTAIIMVPFLLMISLIGLIVRADASITDPSTGLFQLINSNLSIGVIGFVIVGILATIMSSADSYLNTASVIVAHDMYKSIYPNSTAKRELLVARGANLLISGIAAFLSLNIKGLMEILWLTDNFWDPIVLIPFIAGLMSFKASKRAFVYSITTATILTIATAYIRDGFDTVSLLAGAMGSTTGLFSGHLIQKFRNRPATNHNYFRSFIIKFSHIFHVQFKANAVNRLRANKKYYYHLGFFGLIYYLISSLFFGFGNSSTQNLILGFRITALLLCFGLCIHEAYLPKKIHEKLMPVYWYLTTTYCLVFLNVYTALTSGGDFPWMVNLMLSGVLFYIFTNWRIFAFLSIIGSTAAYLVFARTGHVQLLQINTHAPILVSIYGAYTLAILLFLKQKDLFQSEQLDTRLVYSNAVAHEVKNPLIGAAMIADFLHDTFKDKTHPQQLSETDFSQIKEFIPAFQSSNRKALSTIDRTLNAVRVDVDYADDIQICDIDTCVQEAIKECSLTEEEQARVQVKHEGSFFFKGSKHFTIHVIINLVNNSFKYAGSSATIYIWYEDNELHIKDDGLGIAHERLPHILKPFDKMGSTKGTGIGLAFCKQVMEGMGGTIECRSTEGVYTEFVLTFCRDI